MAGNPLRKIPGFRSGSRWRQSVAVAIYGLAGLAGLIVLSVNGAAFLASGTRSSTAPAAPSLAASTTATPAAAPQPVAVQPTSTIAPRTATSVPPATTRPSATATQLAPTSTPAPSTPTTTRQPKDANAPCSAGQIKGNRNSHIYHSPGQRDYARTTANVECFDTAAQAQAAGYRPAQR